MKLKKQQCPFIWLKTINWLRSNLKERRRINNAILTRSLNWFLLKFITTIVTVCHHHSGANPAPEIPQNTSTYKLPSGRWQLVDMSQIIKPTMVPSIVIFFGRLCDSTSVSCLLSDVVLRQLQANCGNVLLQSFKLWIGNLWIGVLASFNKMPMLTFNKLLLHLCLFYLV